MSTDRNNQIRESEHISASDKGVAQEKENPAGKTETGLNEPCGTHVEKNNQIQITVAESGTLRKELEDAKAVIRDLQLRLTTLNAELTQKHDREEKVLEQVGLLSDELIEMEALLRQNAARLERIGVSAGWRLEKRYRAITDRLFPYGTWRRDACRRTINRLMKARAGSGDMPDISHPRRELSGLPSPSLPAMGQPQGPQSGPELLIRCFSPQPGELCVRRRLIRGWLSFPGEVPHVQILVDGMKAGDAIVDPPGTQTEDASAHCRGAGNSEFFYLWDTSSTTEGAHTLTIRAEGMSGVVKELVIPVVVSPWSEDPTFQRWIQGNEPSHQRWSIIAGEANEFSFAPLISIVTTVFDTSAELLKEAIASVQRQVYRNWEFCLAVDIHSRPELTGLLEAFSREDPRIKYVRLAENQGMSAAANAALALAHGEFCAFMGSGDLLSPDSLYWNIKLLQDHRDADLIYSDEDQVDLAGNRGNPFFKPDWSPDLLLSHNYIGHLLVVRRQVLNEIGGLRNEYEGSQNYDLILRLTERTQRIFHIPRILFHDRGGPGLRASSTQATSQARAAAERALSDYLKRNGIPARVEQGCTLGRWQVRYKILEAPRVAVILPTGGRMDILQPCLESLVSRTAYPHYEILLVDNSKDGQVEQYAKSLANPIKALRYLDYRDKKFNFSALNNFAAGQTDAPFLLLLNDDITVVEAGWLSAMVEQGQRPTVGAVGAKLIYPSGNIQHAGVLMGIYECISHAFKHLPANSLHYFAFPQMIRNCSAVTAACMLTRRAVYWEMGGLDETSLAVAFQDVDYCLKLCKAGYRIVYTPLARLIHYESVTKEEKIPNWKEVRYMQKKWREVIAHDPFYNPNLTRKAEDYSLRLD